VQIRRALPTFISPRSCGGALLISLLAQAGTLAAQEVPVIVGKEFSAQRFDAAPGPRNYFHTRGARTDGRNAWSAGLLVSYANEPIVVNTCVSEGLCGGPDQTTREIKVVENLVEGAILGSFTPIPRLQIGLKLPLAFADGHGMNAQGQPDTLSAFALADPQVEVKLRAYGEPTSPIVAGVAVYATAPLGHLMAERAYLGDETPGVGLRAIFDGEAGPFSFAGNVGGILRGTGSLGEAEVGDEVRKVEVGSELRYSVGLGWRPSPVLRVLVDWYGSSRLATTPAESPMQIDGGVQVSPLGSTLMISAGGGTRLVSGLGAPAIHALLGFTYVAEHSDRDEDGMQDADDQCPTDAEDRDGYEDSDGCPDLDNDLDTIPDKGDKCPAQAEDQDGFEDQDGCPDFDNDKDGVPDVGDRCPNEAETKNGFDDTDGCPDVADQDRDGVPDDKDQCAAEPEDTDGFEDTNGCPDPDNDADGVVDNQDECVDEPETINKFEDEDGCPDDPKQKRAPKPAAKPNEAPTPKPGEVLEL
jgi:OOP family OmpA-OmpF porin